LSSSPRAPPTSPCDRPSSPSGQMHPWGSDTESPSTRPSGASDRPEAPSSRSRRRAIIPMASHSIPHVVQSSDIARFSSDTAKHLSWTSTQSPQGPVQPIRSRIRSAVRLWSHPSSHCCLSAIHQSARERMRSRVIPCASRKPQPRAFPVCKSWHTGCVHSSAVGTRAGTPPILRALHSRITTVAGRCPAVFRRKRWREG
jgi:hypothetical protein